MQLLCWGKRRSFSNSKKSSKEYVCQLYGEKNETLINEARYKIFTSRKKNAIT